MRKKNSVESSPNSAPVRPPRLKLPRSTRLPPELTLRGDAVVVSDVHVLAVRRKLVEKVAEVGKRYGIGQVVIVGDLLSVDVFAAYPKLFVSSPFKAEVTSARAVLEYWLGVFGKAILVTGNHDERFIKSAQGEVDIEMMGDLLLPGALRGRLVVSPYDRAWLKACSGTWLLAHQHEYSRNPLVVANKLAAKYQCHVITAHEHHFAVGVSQDNQFMVVNNPCLCEESKTPYKALRTNSYPSWKLGFSFLKDGEFNFHLDGHPSGVK